MPEINGMLTQEEFNRVSVKLYEKWFKNGGRPPCRSCGETTYYIHPMLIGNRSDTRSVTDPHSRQPTIMVYCSSCGFAEHYVAWVLGIEVLQVENPVPVEGGQDG